ncbi:PKD domain-containing protein [Christiangramia flava]|uniref:Beta-glucanase n=1 Tax=Christiangramia flava JLT2011 TaxID=1229726 RepID=A0A1L7I5B9_9FLAO|nr:PKD domain-containing protein [Christiangramia flava]APU68292.1 Beta-glucanase precursor [Christiangramia flava JLT2011]OSS40921.1 hypothetical protein C723_0330 [Christiangramia flava JLT2011]
MKIFRLLMVLFISALCFTACEDEEITNYAFQDVSAPANVTADFDIAQDDSGTVTITPSGEGAQTFQVYFGDEENETPTEIAAGETISYTYGEGEYLVRIVAVGSTGLTSEFNQRLVIAFKAPENLQVNIDQDASNPATINISATADYATMYDVYFGDAEDEEPTQLMPDETITYTYAAPGTYTVRVVAKGAGVATTETTVEVVVPEANDPVKLPITYDVPTVNYALGTFNGASFEVVDNPFLSGANPEASKVGAITNSGSLYEGGAYNLGEPVDFSGDNKTISMKFYSEEAVSVLVKFEGGPNGERPVEVSADHGGTGWEELTFNFASDAVASYLDGADDNGASIVPDGQYNTLVLFVEIGEETAGTFYFDDIMQEMIMTDPFKLPVTFDDENVVYTNSGAGFEVVANPQQNGINDVDTNVGAVTNAGQQYEAVTFTLDEPVDFSSDNKTITMKVYSEVAYPVLFKFETGVNGERANEVEVNHGGTGWEELTFDFNNARKSYVDGDPENGADFAPTGQYNQFSIFLDFAGTTAGTFYIDDIVLNGETGGSGTEPTSAAPTPTLEASKVISMFSDAYTNVPVDTWKTDWSDSGYAEVSVAGNVVKYYSSLNFVGIETTSNQIDASGMTHFHTDYWTGNATVFRVKLVDFGPNGSYQGGDDTEHELEFTVTPNTWVSLDIPLSDFTGLTNTSNIAQLIFSAAPAGEADVYVDNVYFHN